MNRSLVVINDVIYNSVNFKEMSESDKITTWEKALYTFLSEWFSDKEFITVQTSGSTGEPKSILVRRDAMIESARRTISFFGLNPGNSVLLCLPVSYIAGKMMVVRALVGKMNIVTVEPSGLPLCDLNKPVDFAAFTPMQMMNELSNVNNPGLQFLRKVIIGGGAVNKKLSVLLSNYPFEAYETYGMTETLSHIALRQINGNTPQNSFYPLPDVNISTDERGCLILDVPGITNGEIITNDFVEIQTDGSFCITGRFDNVINSGGIKIQPEKIEEVISSVFSGEFYISFVVNELLGQQVVMVVDSIPDNTESLFANIGEVLSRYQMPASLYQVKEFPLSASGKIKRTVLKKMISASCPVFVWKRDK